nr:crosslink repair DNA glycosylase YcaQ family protein [Paenibacillus nanensis]
MPAKAFESEERVHGYWDNDRAKTKATSHALNLLMDAAQIRIVGREGNQRLFDVTDRSVPAELLSLAGTLGEVEAGRLMTHKYMRAYRIFEPSDARFGWQRLKAAERRAIMEQGVAAGVITALAIEELERPYYMLTSDLDCLIEHQRQIDGAGDQADDDAPISFLPPLDNLLWSRKRLEDLFGFEYRWEIYTPAVKRKYGYYAMPILAGDRLIGRIDPRLDEKQKHLKVELLQIEPGIKISDKLRSSLTSAIEAFAKSHGAQNFTIPAWT